MNAEQRAFIVEPMGGLLLAYFFAVDIAHTARLGGQRLGLDGPVAVGALDDVADLVRADFQLFSAVGTVVKDGFHVEGSTGGQG